jgi:hypothetical protein
MGMPAAAVAAAVAGPTSKHARGLMKRPLAAVALLCLFVSPGAVCERSVIRKG